MISTALIISGIGRNVTRLQRSGTRQLTVDESGFFFESSEHREQVHGRDSRKSSNSSERTWMSALTERTLSKKRMAFTRTDCFMFPPLNRPGGDARQRYVASPVRFEGGSVTRTPMRWGISGDGSEKVLYTRWACAFLRGGVTPATCSISRLRPVKSALLNVRSFILERSPFIWSAQSDWGSGSAGEKKGDYASLSSSCCAFSSSSPSHGEDASLGEDPFGSAAGESSMRSILSTWLVPASRSDAM
jgi:hypothetical protein